jgi:hypothetical protein
LGIPWGWESRHCVPVRKQLANFYVQLWRSFRQNPWVTLNPFSVTVMLGAVNTATAFLAMVLTDKLGRRRVFLVISRSHDSNYLV